MQSYLITSPEFYTQNSQDFSVILKNQLQKHLPNFALYRDKENLDSSLLAKDFVEICHQFSNIKAFIHSDIDLAKKLKADGVHLPFSLSKMIQKAKASKLEVIVSTHSYAEVLQAQEEGADYVTYSPIFASPNKGEPKGIKDLEDLLQKVNIKVFALGGIVNEKEIEAIAKTSAFGFASIRYFY